MESLINFEHVSKTFFTSKEETVVLDDLSFSLNNNEIIAIIGPSGCGKSTILNLMSELTRPSAGHIKKCGSIGYMFQRDNLFDWRNVVDNIHLGLEIQHQMTKENKAYVQELVEKYGLGEFKNFYPSQLSGGMRQRVALIRTLTLKPEVLLLDEPFSALDYQTRLMVLDDVYSIIKQEKKSAIIVTHDISEAISFADRVIVLSARPSRIKKIFDIHFALDGEKTPLKVRNCEEFHVYFEEIFKELHADDEKR